MHRILLTVVLLGFSFSAFSAQKQRNYVGLGLSIPDFSFDIESKTTDENGTDPYLSYSPYIPVTAILEIGFGGFSLGVSIDVEEEEPSEDQAHKKIKTSYENYDLSYFFKHAGIALSYANLEGMNIIEAHDKSESELEKDRDAHRADITLVSKAASVYLTPLSYNLSLSDFFDHASFSRGSGIGLMFMGSYDDLEEKSSKSVIPERYAPDFGEDASFMGGHFISYSGSIGPAFVIDIYGLYLSGLVTYGSGMQQVIYQSQSFGERTAKRQSSRTNIFASLGYKGSSCFTSFEYDLDSPIYDLNSIEISTTKSNITWISGLRF